jgi:8-amino-7-oxononanoate synthase
MYHHSIVFLVMSSSLRQFFETALGAREKSGLMRVLKTVPLGLTDFASNDYLGLANSALLRKDIQLEIENHQPATGATGSRLLTGNSSIAEDAEAHLASLFKAESSLLFNSGYSANLAVLSSIPQKGDTILYDELAHTSLKDGARLSIAKRYSFRHNDLNDLEGKIKKSKGRIFIVVESVYSMDGDASPLKELVGLAKQYDACLILDEAHSTGLCSPEGTGMSVAMNLQDDIDIRIYTLGKAMGMHGAFVAGKKIMREYLINFARPFIYTTAPSPHFIVSVRAAFQFLRKNPHLHRQLDENIRLYLSMSGGIENKTTSESAIQTIVIPENEAVKTASKVLSQAGFDVRAILSPTVPKGKERLRICLHAFNTADEIVLLTSTLAKICATA